MAAEETHRSVSLSRSDAGKFRATNVRGGTLDIGSGDDSEFTPVELLLAAIAGCSGIDVDILTSRRSDPESFAVEVSGEKIRDENGNRLTDLQLRFSVSFPGGESGDAARRVLPDAVRRSHERLCTVGRTVELASPIDAGVGE